MKRNCHCEEQRDEAIQLDRHVRRCRTRDNSNGISRRPRRAFTLIELLVAAAITAVMAGFVATIVSNVGSLWSQTSGRLSTGAQARFILDQLSLDLSSARFQDDGNVWLAANFVNASSNSGLWVNALTVNNQKPNNTTSFIVGSASIADDRFGLAGVWLRFFSTSRGSNTAATPTTISAPVAVGYQIIRRFTAVTATNQNTGYFLHRAEVRPAATTGTAARPGVLESGYNITAAAYTTSTVSTNNGSTAGDPRSIQVPGTARGFDSVIAENVIDLGFRAYVRDATQPGGLRLIFPVGPDGTSKTATTATRLQSKAPSNTPAGVLASTNTQPFPDVIDVMVRILTDEGARLIAAYEANPPSPAATALPTGVNAQQYWWQVALAHSQVYTRRIVITAQPL
jgi:prepilin-type N-terminal cleavage/methylation domain-containing protein